MKVLVCSDIHIGRVPSVTPSLQYDGHAGWEAVVGKAVELKVDVLCLVGDVIHQERSFLEAYGPLLLGLEQLKEAGIEVVAVGGNHDWSLLPRLVKEHQAIRILGFGGKWDACTLGGVTFVGWSFPASHIFNDPFDTFDPSMVEETGLSLGLLHCEISSSGGRYAPVQASRFLTSKVNIWALGHIHGKADIVPGKAFYCGSPFAFDKSEEGQHGVFLLESDEEVQTWKPITFLPLCPYRFETLEVDITTVSNEEELKSIIASNMRVFAQTLDYSGTLYCKLLLRGIQTIGLDVQAIMEGISLDQLHMVYPDGKTAQLLGDFEDASHLDVDLVELSKGTNPAALLAKLLVDEADREELSASYRELENESQDASAYQMLGMKSADFRPGETEQKVLQAGKHLLRAILAQLQETR